jgi:hypothetical protein
MSSQTKPIYLRNKLEIVEYYLIKTGVFSLDVPLRDGLDRVYRVHA